MLTGRAVNERTIASTSQMVDARTGDWNRDFLEKLGLPTEVLGEICEPGETIGKLRSAVQKATGLSEAVQVIATPSHDTASAVAAVPAHTDTDWCYLSSGTWSLLGCELDEPCINDVAAKANFTNELGVGGTVRFLRNIAGLWPVQEIRRQLEREGRAMDYAELTEAAAGSTPLQTLIPVNDPEFAAPGRMIDRIQAYARQTDQPVPETPGSLVRCCLESLACEYHATLSDMQQLLGRTFATIHIVGGGGKNGLLNRMTAHATGCKVVVGPQEATVIGNLLTQAMGLGHIEDRHAIREVVKTSTQLQTVEAGNSDDWQKPIERYTNLPASKPFEPQT
jgi:rhamnulokinase